MLNAMAPSGSASFGGGIKLNNPATPKTKNMRPISTRAMVGKKRVNDLLAGGTTAAGKETAGFMGRMGLTVSDEGDEAIDALAPALIEAHLLMFVAIFHRPVQGTRRVVRLPGARLLEC